MNEILNTNLIHITAGITMLVIMIIFGYKKRTKNYKLLINNSIISSKEAEKSHRLYIIYSSILLLIIYILSILVTFIHNDEINYSNTNNEIVFLLDISNSMNVEDIGMPRLSAAKKTIINLIPNLMNTNFTVLLFAAEPQILIPMSNDIPYASSLISEIETDFIENQGTNLAIAIENSITYFSSQTYNKILILLTDAENHEKDIETALAKLKVNNISIHCIGFGTISGGKIPTKKSINNEKYLSDYQGNEVVSKSNMKLIEHIDKKYSLYPFDVDNFLSKIYSADNNNVDINQLNNISIILMFCILILLFFVLHR